MWLLSALTGLILTISCRVSTQQVTQIAECDGSRYHNDWKPREYYGPREPCYPSRFTTGNECGIRQPYGVGDFMVNQTGGAEFGEFPWVVGLYLIRRRKQIPRQFVKVYNCVGSLIHRQAVLTAGHCVDKYAANELIIRAGEWDTGTLSEKYPYQERLVRKIVSHRLFDPNTLVYDLAILILTEFVELAPHIGLVCLPEQDYSFHTCRCFAGGWGRDGSENAPFSRILKEIEIPIVEPHCCAATMRVVRNEPDFQLHPPFVCAGGEGIIDLCNGDSGAPLVCAVPENDNRYTQAAVASWGEGCGVYNVPGVYANVSSERYWIDEVLRENCLI